MDTARKSKKINCILVILLTVLAFFLGRSFGFHEACKLYDPVIQKSQELIKDLQSQIDEFRQEKIQDNFESEDYGFKA